MRDSASGEKIALGWGERSPALLSAEPLLAAIDQPAEQLWADYVRVFGLVACRDCPPYETEYQPNEDTFFRAQQMADVSGFYRAFGLEPGRNGQERPDCLRLELEFTALLLNKERLAASAEDAAVCRSARESFVRDHLSWWIPSFARALRRKAETGLYAALADYLAGWLPIERDRLHLPAPHSPLAPLVVEQECQGCMNECAGA
jgi:TorA maturation chaperone TorD